MLSNVNVHTDSKDYIVKVCYVIYNYFQAFLLLFFIAQLLAGFKNSYPEVELETKKKEGKCNQIAVEWYRLFELIR